MTEDLVILDKIEKKYGLDERLKICDYLNMLNPTRDIKEYTINRIGEFSKDPYQFVKEYAQWEKER
jgi:hypothetical protein